MLSPWSLVPCPWSFVLSAEWSMVEGTPHPALRVTFLPALTPHILWGPLPEGEGGKLKNPNLALRQGPLSARRLSAGALPGPLLKKAVRGADDGVASSNHGAGSGFHRPARAVRPGSKTSIVASYFPPGASSRCHGEIDLAKDSDARSRRNSREPLAFFSA